MSIFHWFYRIFPFVSKKPRSRLTPSELQQAQELNRIAAQESFKAFHFEKNTALIGKDGAEKQKNVASLMERLKSEFISSLLGQLGYTHETKTSIDLKTGKILIVK